MRHSGRSAGLVQTVMIALLALAATSAGAGGPTLSDTQRTTLDENWRLCQLKKKGPFTANTCLCKDGSRDIVRKVNGVLVMPCDGKEIEWCEAFRSEWGQALADEGMYLANLFQRDLYLWDEFPDHHDLVRGYILEKFFIDHHPEHKLAVLRSYGGLSGSEFEASAAPLFFERYLALPSFSEPRHYLLAYELQRRFHVRNDQGQIQKVRNLAVQIQRAQADFKPLRDAVHNQISPQLIPQLAAYRDAQPEGAVRDKTDALITELHKLTSLDSSALEVQLGEIEDQTLRASLQSKRPPEDAPPIVAIDGLAQLMVLARDTVEAKQVPPSDRRRLIDLAITAGVVIQSQGASLLASGPRSAEDHLHLLRALTDAAYGAGLLMQRERQAALASIDGLLANPQPDARDFERGLARAARVVEWSQRGTLYAFEEVLPPWLHLVPDVKIFPDDVLRGSSLLLYGQVMERLQDFTAGEDRLTHEVFGTEFDVGVRVLNPGLSKGTLRVDAPTGTYSRVDVVALRETPADLEPAAGILTQGEGNVVSHVQLLARSLGIPNVVLGPGVFEEIAKHDGEPVFFVATPRGRLVLKEAAAMSAQDQQAEGEFRGTKSPDAEASIAESAGVAKGGAAGKLRIDVERLDLDTRTALDLRSVRRSDSGTRCGPKAAYLGELAHHFPAAVGRGAVVPFGAYYAHYRNSRVAIPPDLKTAGIAKVGTPLPEFVESTYRVFFDEMMPEGRSEAELSEWIQPRLAVMSHSIREAPLSDALIASIRSELGRQGLLAPSDPSRTIGIFVRSDTNVEDLDEFSGAGLNLTLFNLQSLDDIFAGIKEVWASPFTYRSFAWRQTLIDQPLWVLPSVVILESTPSDKSGVAVTADIENGDPTRILIATSEGVGGAVDGTSTETLLWSTEGVELITMFKSPWRRLLRPDGGSEMVSSSRSERVLSEDELQRLVAAAHKIRDEFEPVLDSSGRPRPWDIEYGFADGKLRLFQTRPFVGSEQLSNVSALSAYDPPRATEPKILSLSQMIP